MKRVIVYAVTVALTGLAAQLASGTPQATAQQLQPQKKKITGPPTHRKSPARRAQKPSLSERAKLELKIQSLARTVNQLSSGKSELSLGARTCELKVRPNPLSPVEYLVKLHHVSILTRMSNGVEFRCEQGANSSCIQRGSVMNEGVEYDDFYELKKKSSADLDAFEKATRDLHAACRQHARRR